MNAETIAAVLCRTTIFSGLSDATVARVAERTIPRHYARNQPVFLEGDAGESMFVVAEGTLKLSVVSPEGDEMVLTTFGPDDVFGEMSLLDGGRRSASVHATGRATVLALTRSTVLDLIGSDRDLADRLFEHLGRVVRRLSGQTADLVFLDLDGRVAKLLADLAMRHGDGSDGTLTLELTLTQTELAQMVGGSRQSVNQALRALEKDGVLSVDRRTMTIHDLDALRARSAGSVA